MIFLGISAEDSLKSHILCDHYEEHFTRYENIANAGAAISSEQSGEMLHSKLQRSGIYDSKLRQKIKYFLNNYDLKWDKSIRSVGNTDEDQKEFNLEGDSNEHGEERIKLHNWLTDSEYSDKVLMID